MEDLAQTVMDQLQTDDGPSEFIAVSTWKGHSGRYSWNHVLLIPVTKNGTTTYNVETAEWSVYGFSQGEQVVEPDDMRNWKTTKVCNFATAEQAAEFLWTTGQAFHPTHLKDRTITVPMSMGVFGRDLLNQTPVCINTVEAAASMLKMLAYMRPTVEA